MRSAAVPILFASRPEVIGRVLGIVYRCIAIHLINKAGLSRETAQTGVVALIRRFGSPSDLNFHSRSEARIVGPGCPDFSWHLGPADFNPPWRRRRLGRDDDRGQP